MKRRLGVAFLALAVLLLAPSLAWAGDLIHVVRKGQYLNLIAKRYHTTADAIRKANGLKKGEPLKPGVKLRIPETPAHRAWREHIERTNPKLAPKKPQPAKPKPQAKPARPKPPKPPQKAAAKPASKPATAKKDPPTAAAAKNAPPKTATKSDPHRRKAPRPGYVVIKRHGEVFRGVLRATNGKVVAASTAKLDHLLRSLRTKKQQKIDRRLLYLLSLVSDDFGGRPIEVVSGYRPYSPTQYTRNSRHNHGQAIDFRIEGVPARAVYERCLEFDKVGCGYYPNSHFVHMDVRDLKTRWIDYSGPGERPRYARNADLSKPAPKKSAPKKNTAKKSAPKTSNAKKNTAKKSSAKPRTSKKGGSSQSKGKR